MQLAPALTQVEPPFGISVGQPLPPPVAWQYHARGMGMHAPPSGGHDEHSQTAPFGYEQSYAVAPQDACCCG